MVDVATLTPLLAGTQCTQCGYESCLAYAQAVVGGEAANLCKPGGVRVARDLASVLARAYVAPAQEVGPAQVVMVREEDCIGCTLCLQKCPTGAFVGATKQIHTVMADMCTGCGLCVPVCPAQCIDFIDGTPVTGREAVWDLVYAARAREGDLARDVKGVAVVDPVVLAGLSTDLEAKISAAREKSSAKYAAKGPMKTPQALRRKKKP